MVKAIKIILYILNCLIILPFVVLWAIAGVIAQTLWTIFEVYDGSDNL